MMRPNSFNFIVPGRCKVSAAILVCGSLLLVIGCQTDWNATRHLESDEYSSRLQEETRQLIERFPQGVDLTNATAIAKERNTRLAASQIAAKVAQMDRKAAFSVFLPQVQVTYNALSLSEEPLKRFGEDSLALQDKNVQDFSVQIVQPLFAPSAWLLYRSAKRGAEIASLAQERTEQMIELSVVNQFHQCGATAFTSCAPVAPRRGDNGGVNDFKNVFACPARSCNSEAMFTNGTPYSRHDMALHELRRMCK